MRSPAKSWRRRRALLVAALALAAGAVHAQPSWLATWTATPAPDIAGTEVALAGVWANSCIPTVQAFHQTGSQALAIELATGPGPDSGCFGSLTPWSAVARFQALAPGTWNVTVIEAPRRPANGAPRPVFAFSFQQQPSGGVVNPYSVPSGGWPGWLLLAGLVALVGTLAAARRGRVPAGTALSAASAAAPVRRPGR